MEDGIEEAKEQMGEIYFLLQEFTKTDSLLTVALSKKDYTLEEAKTVANNSVKLFQAVNMLEFFEDNDLTLAKLTRYMEDLTTQVEAHHNLDFEGRSVVGDDPNDINDRRLRKRQCNRPQHKKHITWNAYSGSDCRRV